MKHPPLLVFLVVVLGVFMAHAQDTSQRKIFVVSGMGWGLTGGKTAEVLTPKFSSSLGLDVALRNGRYFVYPSLDFLVFGYDQQVEDPDYSYNLERGRSNLYNLNLAAGIRQRLRPVSAYAFAGPGVGVVSEPRARVPEGQSLVKIENTYRLTPSLRAGVGADIKLGSFYLFLEGAWLHNFRRMQDRPVHVFSIYGGLKTDVTRLAGQVTKAIGIETGISP